jgi:uncharacterized membrane protein
MKDTNAEKSRLQWIDLFRGIAVLWMIETHTSNTFLRAEIHNASWFEWINYANGLVAPGFLFIAGVLQGRAAGKKQRSEVGSQRSVKTKQLQHLAPAFPSSLTSDPRPLTSRLSRVGQLLLIGYALHFPIPFTGGWVNAFSHIDILQCIAISMLVGYCLQGAGKFAIGAAAAFFVFTAPLMSLINLDSLPVLLAGYVNRQNGALFPLFPWAGFFLTGWLCSGLKMRGCLIAAGLCWVGVWVQHIAPEVYPHYDYYLAGPGFFFERLGWLLVGAAACQEAAVLFLGGPRCNNFFKTILTAGKASLAVYVIHLQLVNLFWGGARMLNLPQKTGLPATIAIFLAITALTVKLTGLLALPRVAPACRWLGVHPASVSTPLP